VVELANFRRCCIFVDKKVRYGKCEWGVLHNLAEFNRTYLFDDKMSCCWP